MPILNKRKICKFCENPHEKIDYKNYKLLRRFITEQGKIIPSRITEPAPSIKDSWQRLSKEPETLRFFRIRLMSSTCRLLFKHDGGEK